MKFQDFTDADSLGSFSYGDVGLQEFTLSRRGGGGGDEISTRTLSILKT